MSFWGTEVKPDKVVPFVPPPQDARLHISQACLASGAGRLTICTVLVMSYDARTLRRGQLYIHRIVRRLVFCLGAYC